MRLAYGEGVIIALLAPFVVYLFGKISILQTLFSVFALLGIWTLVSAFLLMAVKERIYYLSWGLILLGISSAFIVHIQYAIGFILIAIIAALLINVATRKSEPKTTNVRVDQGQTRLIRQTKVCEFVTGHLDFSFSDLYPLLSKHLCFFQGSFAAVLSN
jgi:hypothetical protein